MRAIIGVFNDKTNVEEAIAELKEHGFNPKDVSIVMRDPQENREIVEHTGASDVLGGTAAGATTGAVLGGLAGLLAAYAIPGLGAFFIGGPIAAAFGLAGAAAATVSGAATGAAAGGILGALTSTYGLSHEEAREYETRVEEGAILVAVPTSSDNIEVAYEILVDSGADNIKSVDMNPRRATTHREDDTRETYDEFEADDRRHHRPAHI